MTIEITEIAQAFVLFETYELVSFQILVVAHREELLLILELRKLRLGFSWLRYDREKAVWLVLLALKLIDLVLKPSKCKIKAHI